MYRHFLLALSVVISILFVQANCFAIPMCISGLCLHGSLRDLPAENQVNKLLGSSRKAKPSVPRRKSSCHIVDTPKHNKVYVYPTYIRVKSKWRLIAITAASQRLCDDPEALSVDYEFLTEKKIGLGSRKDDIVAAYGKPTYLLDSPSSDLIKSYFPDSVERDAYTIVQYVSGGNSLLTTRFFLFRGVVVGINLSADE